MLAQQRPTELMLRCPRGIDRGAGDVIAGDVGVRERWHYKDPPQEPIKLSSTDVAPTQHARQHQDRHRQDRVRPRGGEPRPDQAVATVRKGR
jgi:hypothetical protein